MKTTSIRSDRELLEILINSLKEGYKPGWHNGSFRGDINFIYTCGIISISENARLFKVLADNLKVRDRDLTLEDVFCWQDHSGDERERGDVGMFRKVRIAFLEAVLQRIEQQEAGGESMRTDRELLELLINSLKEGDKPYWWNTGICTEIADLYIRRTISGGEYDLLQAIVNRHKEVALNQFYASRNSPYWWPQMGLGPEFRQIRIDFLTEVLNRLKQEA